jgi:glycine/D-amino acid oxidase-like deaminating enzyme
MLHRSGENGVNHLDKFKRRDLLKGSLAVGGLVGLQGCGAGSGGAVGSAGSRFATPAVLPLRMSVDDIIDVKCCIRPFRPEGPRLDAEQIGDTLVIHNYGHGGSGWSLSWGSAEIAVGKALSVVPKEIAVVGCGIVGLTAAVAAQRAGLKVTIYAREMFPRTRSVRANGSWTPDSRIALTEPAGAAFGALWEQMARISWKAFRAYVGMPGNPVDFSDQYNLSDTPIERHAERIDPAKGTFKPGGLPQQSGEFAHYSDRIRDIIPQGQDVAPEDNPFGTRYARRASQMYFNFGSYGHLLLSEFFEAGGRFEMRDFHAPSDVTTLREKVVIHSTGFAARELWKDKTMIPVRGQTGWLVPQTEAKYGLRYRDASILSKSDGVMVMHFPGDLGDMLGVGDSSEIPDRADVEAAIKSVAPLFARRA